jgi:hypothetical protein
MAAGLNGDGTNPVKCRIYGKKIEIETSPEKKKLVGKKKGTLRLARW